MPQALADELGKIPMSRSLAASIVRAKDHAGAKGHRLVTLEHLLLALTEDEEAAHVLATCNVDLDRLSADVAGHLARLEREPPGGPAQPPISPELKRIIEYAAAAAQQGRRSLVDGAIVLAATVGEGRSMAAGFLRAQELTFEAVVHALQHLAQQRAATVQQNGAIPPSTEDILANARERIAATRGQGGRVAPPVAQRAPEPENRRPATPRQDAGLGDRAQPPPPVFAERPNELPGRNAGAGSAAADEAGQTDTAPAQAPSRTPPPLPPSLAQDQATSDAPRDIALEAGPDQERPALPEWMRTRQVDPRGEHAGGPPPPPLARNEPELERPAPATVGLGNRPPPTLEAAPRRQSAAPARDPRFGQTPALEPGQLVENIPRRMRVGVTETVEVRVARADADLTGNWPGSSPPARHDLYITKAMSVRLRAPNGGFRIDTASPETQWTEATMGPLSDDFAVWRFAVTPERRGEAVLQLVVAARVLARDGVMAETVLPERVINVRVRTNYVRATMRASGWLAALAAGGVVGRMGEDALALALKLIGNIGAAG